MPKQNIIEDRNRDDLLVYQTLKKRLEEISKSLSEVEPFPEKKPYENTEPIHFQCICVLFVEPDFKVNNIIKSQTFRITTSTKVFEIINAELELWEHLENIDEYKLYLMENEYAKTLSEGDVINNLFKWNKSLVKSTKLLLAPKNYKISLNDIDIKDQGSQLVVSQISNKNEKFDEFIANFTGVAKYIEHKFFFLKEEVEQKKNTYQKKKNLHG